MVAVAIDAVFEGLDMVFGVAADDSESLVSNIADNAAQNALQNTETNMIEGIVSLIWSPQAVECGLIAQDTPSAISVGNTIYCFYNGKTSLMEAGTLCYQAYIAGVTSLDMQVPANVAAPGAPCSVVFNNQIYLFYEGPGNNGQIWYSVYDGIGWTSGVVPNVSMSQSPSATVFNNDLYVFYQSAAANGTICYSVFDGSTWAAEVSPPIGGISESPSVVTFTPPGSSTPQLYVFYQGGGNSGGLFYNVFDGSTWTKNTQVPNVGMSSSPAAAVFDNQIYVAHQGGGNNGQLWYNAFNGSTWAGDIQEPSYVVITDSPALVVCNDEIYVAYLEAGTLQLWWGPLFNLGGAGGIVPTPIPVSSPSVAAFAPGTGSGTPLPYVFYVGNEQLLYNVYTNPYDATGSLPVPNLGISGSASVVLFNNQPYVFYDAAGQLGYSTYDGSSWSSGVLTNVTLSQSPNAVVFNNQIYVFYQDPGNDGQLWYVVLDGSTWAAGGEVLGVSVSDSVSAVVLNNELYVFYQGAGNNGQLWYDVFSGSSWAGPTQVAGASMSGAPSAAVILNNQTGADQIEVLYQGPDNNGALCYSVFDGSTWIAQALVPNVEISASPLAIVFTGVLYVFYEGGGDNAGELWYCMLNGSTWSPEAPVAYISMSGQPSGVVYQPPNYSTGVLYIFHTEASQSGQLWYCSCSSCTWTNGTVSGPGMSCGPAAVVFGNDPWVFYQDLEETGTLCYSVAYSNNVWTAGTVPDASMCQSPSAVAYTPAGTTTPQLCVFYQGRGSGNGDGILLCSAYDGTNWTMEQVPGPGMSGEPSAVVFTPAGSNTPQPYVFYQGPSFNGMLGYSMFNGNGWVSGTVPGGVIMSQSPTAMVMNDLLYVLYEGPGNDGEMFFMSFDGTNWSESTQIGMLQLACSPSLLVLNGRLFCFTQRLGGTAGDSDSGNGELWFTLSNGSYWAWDTQVNNTSMSESPSSVLFNNQAYVFYQGASDNQQLWYSTYNGNWASQTQLIPQGLSSTSSIMSCSPSGVVFTPSGSASAQCYVFYQGPGSNGQLWYNSSSDGSNWGAQAQVIPAGLSAGSALMSQSPSAVVFNDQLYVFYEGGGNDLQICYTSSSDGNSWNSQGQVPGIAHYSPSCSPFAVVFDNNLYVFYNYWWEGNPTENPLGTLYYVVFDGIGWTAPVTPGVTNPANNTSANMYQSPAAVVFEGQLYVYFQSVNADGPLWYTVFDGSNWSTIATAGSMTMLTGPTGAGLAKIITSTQSAFMNFWNEDDDVEVLE